MKRLTQLERIRVEHDSAEVEFPIYSKDEDMDDYGGWHRTYKRIDAEMNCLIITHRTTLLCGGSEDWEVKQASVSPVLRDEDKTMGRGEYSCTAEEFNAVLGKAVASFTALK